MRKQPDISAMRRDIFAVSISDEKPGGRPLKISIAITASSWSHTAPWDGRGASQIPQGGRWLEPLLLPGDCRPCQVHDEIISLIGLNPNVPEVMSKLDCLEEHYDGLEGSYTALKSYLIRVLPRSNVLSR